MKKSNEDFTPIEVECRQMLHPRQMGMMILADTEPGWVRTYSMDGWQRFPITFIEEHTVSVESRMLQFLEWELKAKGYCCSFGTVIQLEKETHYD